MFEAMPEQNWDAEEKADNILKPDKIKSITCPYCHRTSKYPLKDLLHLIESTSLNTKRNSVTTGKVSDVEPSIDRICSGKPSWIQ